jgi:putative ABC transport system permease protein
MNVLIRKALMDITRRKGRSALIIVGILIGVLGLTSLNESTDLIGNAFFYSTDATAIPNITCIVSSLPPSVATAITRLPNIELVQPRTIYLTFWYHLGNGNQDVLQITSTRDTQGLQLGAFQLTSGRMPGPGEIVMDESDQVLQPLALGDMVIVDTPDGQHVALRVVGLARTQGLAIWHIPPSPLGYMNNTALQQVMQKIHGPIVNDLPHGIQLLIKTHDPSNSNQTYQAIMHLLAGVRLQPQEFSGVRNTSFDADTQLGVRGVFAVVQLLTVLTLLLVGIMLFAMVTAFLSEQFKIIGTMKALGGTRLPIVGSYLLTLMIYSISGTLLGGSIGLIAGYQFAVHLAMSAHIQIGNLFLPVAVGPFHADLWVLLISALVGFLLPMLAGLWPLWTGTAITVRQALTAYGIHVETREIRIRIVWRWGLCWMSQIVWLGVRGLLRKPARATLTLLTLVISCAIFFSVQLTEYSLWVNFAHVSNIYHSDMRVDLASSIGEALPAQRAIATLKALPNVTRVEPIDPMPISVAHRMLELNGLLAETQLYQPQLVSGRWLHPHELGTLVINDSATQRLHLWVGEQVFIQFDTRQARLTIVGIVHDVSEVSGSGNPEGRLGEAFTTLDTLNQMRHLPRESAERLWLQVYDHSPQALQALQQRVDNTLNTLGLRDSSALVLTQDLSNVSDTMQLIAILFDTAAIMVALIGLLNLSHTLATSVLEHRLEIGILRAIGATGWRIGTIFGIEGLVLTVLAWGGGIILGLPVALGILHMLNIYMGPIDLSFQPQTLLFTLLFVIVAACLASIGPILAASRIRARSALRYE